MLFDSPARKERKQVNLKCNHVNPKANILLAVFSLAIQKNSMVLYI